MVIKTKSCEGKKSNTATSKNKECSFPKKELEQWLKKRTSWNHADWLNLLDNLREKGYCEWTDCEDGRTQIGQFLESERNKK